MSRTQMQAIDRAHELCRLATEHRMANRPSDALRAAREAYSAASTSGDDQAKAHAAFVLGNTLFDHFQRGAEILFREAMQRLDEAATIYERLGRIDESAVLITIGEALHAIGEHTDARALFTRVTGGLEDPRWSTSDVLARQAEHLRGRALLGLGSIALDTADGDPAALFAAAAKRLAASGTPASVPLLEQLADIVEHDLDDRTSAAQIRAAAARIPLP